MRDLATLLEQFQSMGQTLVGRGPDHPIAPNADARHAVEDFLRQFPALEQAPDYVRFMREYGGAGLEVPSAAEQRWVLFMPGFWEAGQGLCAWNEEGYGPDPDGFLVVAHGFHHVTSTELEFGIFISGQNAPGIYRTRYTTEDWKGLSFTPEEVMLVRKRLGRKWYCGSFDDWLARLVDKGEGLFEESISCS